MSKEQLQQLKEAIKAELNPLLIGLRNEIKELIFTIKKIEENRPKIQKTEVTNQIDIPKSIKVDNPVDKVEISNPQEIVEVKDIDKHFLSLSDSNSKGVKYLVEQVSKSLTALKGHIFKVNIDNQIKLPDIVKVKVTNPVKQNNVQKVKIENSSPGDAIPVVLTDTDKRGFYNALSQLVGFGKQIANSQAQNIVKNPTNSFATIGITSTIVIPANTIRTDLEIVNDSNAIIYLSRGSSAVVGSGIRLNKQGGSYTIDENNLYRGAIHAIATIAGSNITITEGN